MKARLTKSRIERLRPKSSEYTMWDTATPHLGVRVNPSGSMRYIHTAPVDGRLRKRTLGDAKLMPLDEARAWAREIDAEGGRVEEREPCPTFREWVETWWGRHTAHLKPNTLRGYRLVIDRQLIPAFGAKPLDGITKSSILFWFERYSRTYPGGANKALGILSPILEQALRDEIIEKNPARRIKRNPKRRMTRFLDDAEREKLLAEIEAVPSIHRLKALAIKLLLFTGCRCNEILSLRWKEVGSGVLHLEDSKVGPRPVWLNAEAHSILDEVRAMQEKSGRVEHVFPHHRYEGKCINVPCLAEYWNGLRKRARIPDVRLHDLRHSFASEAVRRGIPLPVVSKLLGHSNLTMTMRYAHVSNTDVEEAAERIGVLHFKLLSGV